MHRSIGREFILLKGSEPRSAQLDPLNQGEGTKSSKVMLIRGVEKNSLA